MKNQNYTVGQIFRLGLLKNHAGQPYKDKATVLRIVRSLYYTKVKTPWGPSYAVHQSEIDRHNKRIKN